MRRKVLLFNPRSEFYAMPLGLLAVGSVLDPARFDVRIFDERIDPNASSRILDEAEDAACVGMTVFSGPPIAPALRLSRQVKERFPNVPVVWGGWHPSILPEQCVAGGAVDAVIIGQGESALAELLDVADAPSHWRNVPGLCVPVDGQPRRTVPRPLAKMDGFPPARYELLDVEAYFRRKGQRQLDYSSSRGCPYKCTFCADPMVYRSKWTGLPAERVVAELLALYHKYRMDEVVFLDDDLFASLKRIQSLVDAFIRDSPPFTWKGAARADELCRLPETFFDRLRDAGCRRITVGAESGSQQVLDQIKKQYKVDDILRAADRAAKSGIAIGYNFITGFPGETERDFRATLDVLRAVRRKHARLETIIYLYSPYPGTELVQELERRGLKLPERLEDWEDFNIEGAWLPAKNPRLVRRVRNLNFYFRHAYSDRAQSQPRRLLQGISRLRCERDWYGMPVERYLADAWRSRSAP